MSVLFFLFFSFFFQPEEEKGPGLSLTSVSHLGWSPLHYAAAYDSDIAATHLVRIKTNTEQEKKKEILQKKIMK